MQTGEILNVHNEVRFLTGEVHGSTMSAPRTAR